MKRILCSGWLTERARLAYFACLRLPALVPQNLKSFSVPFGYKVNTLLTKLVRSRWLDNDLSIHKNAKKELGQYPDVLNSRLVNNTYISLARILLFGETERS